jgi:hypothetical protein
MLSFQAMDPASLQKKQGCTECEPESVVSYPTCPQVSLDLRGRCDHGKHLEPSSARAFQTETFLIDQFE